MKSTLYIQLTALATLFGSSAAATTRLSNAEIFARPVNSQVYAQQQWTLRNNNTPGYRETAAQVGQALAGLKPSYISGLIYLTHETIIDPDMQSNFSTIRQAVHATVPDAKFDVEISLSLDDKNGKIPFANASELLAKMKYATSMLHVEGFWFDFYSTAAAKHPDWIAQAISYAHSQNQTVGGNVFGSTVPAGSDAVSFVDNTTAGSEYGFDFNPTEVKKLNAAKGSTILLGHMQSNAQNGEETESNVYIHEWNETRRIDYLTHLASEQCKLDFTFMYPVFWPLYPGAYAYDPVTDDAPGGGTLYDQLQKLVLGPQGCAKSR